MLATRTSRVAGATVLAASVVASGLALGLAPANAAPSTAFTITAIAKSPVAAKTANQVLTVTGTGFSEEELTKVTISACETSATDVTPAELTYIVASATSLLVKTNAFCKAATDAVVTLTDSNGDTVVSTPTVGTAQKLAFVDPPNLAATNPVVTAATFGLTGAEVKSGPITGGTTVRITAGTSHFFNSSTTPLSATLGGVALTAITPHYVSGTTGAVDWFTAKTGPRTTAGAAALSVTSNGITKTFTTAQTGFSYAGTTVTVVPAFGPSNGGNTIKVNGAGFVPTGTGASTVTICGVNAPVVATGSTATSLNVTVPAITIPAGSTEVDGACTVKVTTGALASVVGSGSTYTYVAQG